jgi:serine/threonine protein kinase
MKTVTTRVTSYVGQVLCDRYRVTREIGSGGFGTVYLAQDEKLVSKPVVVKVLNHLTADTWVVRKFQQEIEALARIDHPGVVAVLDEGETPEGGKFLVMQFIDGVTLRKLIQPGGMDLRRAATILRQIGSALGAAHEKGVYHRDLKPENIMVQSPDSDPRVRLIDFGIAGIKDSLYSQADNSTRIAGTYRYMAPEQLEGKAGPENDVYAFGAIAYELLTGEPPIKSPLELIALKLEGLKTKPRDLRRELPVAAQDVILKAMSFDASERYSSAREMGDLLADTLLGVDSRGAGSTRTADPPETESTHATVPPADRLEIAHVLFLDLVGFSTLTMEEQRALLDVLQSLVRGTMHFVQAEQASELIALPTGDGMALVFFGNPIAAAECALEIARGARSNPAIRLRTGLHSGPVYRVADINKNLNVTGGGINMAQRVMDAGDAGHILVSGALAETLMQFGGWKDRLSDLGEHAVKHGAMMRFYNLCAADAGNGALPSKWAPPKRTSRGVWILGSIVVAIAAAAGIYIATHPADVPEKKAVVVPAALTTQLEYFITLIPAGKTDAITGASERASYRAGDRLAITVKTVQPGFLYLLDDGPMPDKKRTPAISVLRPAPETSAEALAGQVVRTPTSENEYLMVDAGEGNEDVYVVWSVRPVPFLERVKNLTEFLFNPLGGDGGQVTIREPVRLNEVRDFLIKRMDGGNVKKEERPDGYVVSTNHEILVHRIRLAHD